MVDYIREPPPTGQYRESLTAWLDRLNANAEDGFRQTTEDLEFLAAQMVFSQYAAVEVDIPHVDGDIGAGWQPFDFYNTETVTPKGIAIALGGDFTFLLDGVFVFTLNGFLEHNNLNAGRTFSVRLFNVTDDVPAGSSEFLISSGRNTDGTVVPLTAMIEIPAATLGNIFRLEYGGTLSVYSAVIWNSLQFAIWSVSEFRGIVGAPAGASAQRLITDTGDFLVTNTGDRITTT